GARRIAHPERSEAGEENVLSDAVIGETKSKGRPGSPLRADVRSGDSAGPFDSVPATGAALVQTHRGRHFAQGERGGRRIAHPERSEAGEENVLSDAVIGETKSKGRPGSPLRADERSGDS